MMFPGNLLGAWRKSAIEALASTKRLPTESREGQKSTLLRNFVRCAFQVTFYAHWFAFVAEKVPKWPPQGGGESPRKSYFYVVVSLGRLLVPGVPPGTPQGAPRNHFSSFSDSCSIAVPSKRVSPGYNFPIFRVPFCRQTRHW